MWPAGALDEAAAPSLPQGAVGAAGQDPTCSWQQGQPPRSPSCEPAGAGQGRHVALEGQRAHRVQRHTRSSSPTSNTLTLDRISQEFRERKPDTSGS